MDSLAVTSSPSLNVILPALPNINFQQLSSFKWDLQNPPLRTVVEFVQSFYS